MMSIGQISSAGSGYYIGQQSKTGAYYADNTSKSFWGGKAAEELGLAGKEVDAALFDQFLRGNTPDGQRVGKSDGKGGWIHDPGRDLTFTQSKSVSLLSQGPLRADIHATTLESVKAAMTLIERDFVKNRKGELGQKLIWAAFPEDTSRANDPNTHVHVVLMNMVKDKEGNWRASDNSAIYDNQILPGQAFRASTQERIMELGFHTQETGKYGQWEIKDIPLAILGHFSKRAKSIQERVDPENDNAKSREIAAILSRPKKDNIPRQKLFENWNAELKTFGTSFEKLSKPVHSHKQEQAWTAPKAVKIALEHIAETRSRTTLHEILTETMTLSGCQININRLEAEIINQVQKGTLLHNPQTGLYARAKDVDREDLVSKELKAQIFASGPLVPKERIDAALTQGSLKTDQQEAIGLFLRTHSGFAKWQGNAGVGKTTALATAIPLIKAQGYKTIGLSTTSGSTEELVKTGAFDKTTTLQQFLLTPEGDKNTVLVVDESSQIGTVQMLDLVRIAKRRKMKKVLFLGDGKQMGAVQAGTPFKDMDKVGVPTAVLDEIIRQRSGRHRTGITQLTIEDLRGAFATLKPDIHEVAKGNMVSHAIEKWKETKNLNTPVIVQTNRQKAQINAAIKAELIKNDPPRASLTQKVWKPVHKSAVRKNFVKFYIEATHIRFNGKYKKLGINSGDIFKIEKIDHDKHQTIISKDGKSRIFSPAAFKFAKSSIELYRQEDITVHVGDRIRFTRGGQRQPVKNNSYGTIAEIKGNAVTFNMDGKKKPLTLTGKSSHIRHIDHGWASTTHAFQGKTVDHAVVLMPSGKSPLTTLESLYTAASRHRATLAIVTDDTERLKQSISTAIGTSNFLANSHFPERDEASEQTNRSEKPNMKSQITEENSKSQGRLTFISPEAKQEILRGQSTAETQKTKTLETKTAETQIAISKPIPDNPQRSRGDRGR